MVLGEEGPGGYHLPPVLSAPSAHLPGEDQGVWGGALGQAKLYEENYKNGRFFMSPLNYLKRLLNNE